MRKFQFSLQAALAMRERAVEAAETALRLVQEEWNANQQQQLDLQNEVREEEIASREGPVIAVELAALDRFREAAQRRRQRMAQESVQIARRLAERQAALQNAERDRTLLVRLKEKAVSRWQLEYDKEQQLLAEEAYLSRWKARQH